MFKIEMKNQMNYRFRQGILVLLTKLIHTLTSFFYSQHQMVREAMEILEAT